MKKVITLHPVKKNIPVYDRRLRVAAYCRVSSEHDEQDGSIELQENYFRSVIDGNRNWTNAGIFTERTTGLKLKNRKQFNAMIRKCKSGKIDLILTKSISRFGRNTFDELKTLQDLGALCVDVYFELEKLWLHDQQVQIVGLLIDNYLHWLMVVMNNSLISMRVSINSTSNSVSS